MLTGTEVKSLREGKAQLKDSYAVVRDGEVWLIGLYIPPYGPAARDNHEPERPRKLLLKRSEIERLVGRTHERGLTLVPTRIYFAGHSVAREDRDRAGPREGSIRQARERSASARWRGTCSGSCARRSGSTGEGACRARIPARRQRVRHFPVVIRDAGPLAAKQRALDVVSLPLAGESPVVIRGTGRVAAWTG